MSYNRKYMQKYIERSLTFPLTKRCGQDGAVSMLTVVFLSILLVLITMAFIGTAVSEQRNATNADLSTRAYYAAQAGFEDAVRHIKADPGSVTDKDKCPPTSDYGNGVVASSSSGIDASYTCQLVSLNTTDLSYDNLAANDAVLFPIVPADSVSGSYTLYITWASSGEALTSDKSLPPVSEWGSGAEDDFESYPAMLRTNFVWYESGSITNSSIKSKGFYLMPSDAAESPSPSINLSTSSAGAPNEPIKNTQCVPDSANDTYSCTSEITVDSLNGHKLFVAIRPIYKPVSSVNLSLHDSSGKKVSLEGQATIDVTGKAGNVYRRIKQSVPYGKYQVREITSSSTPIPDFSMIGGNGICKETFIGLDPGDYIPANGVGNTDCK